MRAESLSAPARPALAACIALAAIRGYQLLFSPMYAGSCRFVPSCSQYASEAILRFGVVKGTGLAVRRLMRCHPFGSHGLDPVPDFAPTALRPDSAPAALRRGEQVTPDHRHA